MEQTAYITIPKGRGLLYACDNQLYRQAKKRGSIVYLVLHRFMWWFCEDRQWSIQANGKWYSMLL